MSERTPTHGDHRPAGQKLAVLRMLREIQTQMNDADSGTRPDLWRDIMYRLKISGSRMSAIRSQLKEEGLIWGSDLTDEGRKYI